MAVKAYECQSWMADDWFQNYEILVSEHYTKYYQFRISWFPSSESQFQNPGSRVSESWFPSSESQFQNPSSRHPDPRAHALGPRI